MATDLVSPFLMVGSGFVTNITSPAHLSFQFCIRIWDKGKAILIFINFIVPKKI